MKRVEAYEVKGILYRSKEEAEVADWTQKILDQYFAGSTPDTRYYMSVSPGLADTIKILKYLGWKAPVL